MRCTRNARRMLRLMSSLRLNLRGHLDTVLLCSDGRRFWCPRIAAANRQFHSKPLRVICTGSVFELLARTDLHPAEIQRLLTAHCDASYHKPIMDANRPFQFGETTVLTFDLECTNCHARKVQFDAWRQKYGVVDFVCCEGPYVIVPPATCSDDLMLRSLPRGEDR